MSNDPTIIVRNLGQAAYLDTWRAMQAFTQHRDATTPDEIWILEHPPVFTQGQNGKAEHVLAPGKIPVIPVDRGGQVTYHGPGQIVAYILLDIQRKKFNVRQLVHLLEQAVIDVLTFYHIESFSKCEAPGVYVNHSKICSIGLRIRRGATFHGLALNVDMDLEPFKRINPCGFSGLNVIQMKDLNPTVTLADVKHKLIACLLKNLGYNTDFNLAKKSYGTENN